jgi:signal transduction histidine kinase
VAAVLERSMDSLHQVIKDIRSYIFDLRPKVSQVDDLPEAIRQLVEDVRVNTLMDAQVAGFDSVDGLLSEPQALALFHIAQEALNNVAKHSRASIVNVSLTASEEYVRLEVQDNGSGFPTDSMNEEKHGLRNMRDRARAIGAQFSCESEPGKGTTIIAELPMQPKEPANG